MSIADIVTTTTRPGDCVNTRRRTPCHKKSHSRRRRLRHLAWLENRQRKHVRRRRREGNRNRGFTPKPVRPAFNEHTANSVTRAADGRLIIELPACLDFEGNFENTCSHFSVLRQAVHDGTRVKYLRFHKLRSISPSAALVLASEVDRWNQQVKGRLKANLTTWDPDIERLLCQMGYFELLGLERPKPHLPEKSTNFLPFRRGELQKQDGGPLAKQLRIDIETLLGTEIKKQYLYEGLSEAITNVGQHAYHNATEKTLKQWWLSASYDRDTGTLCVMFFDQGEGIPKTLPRAYFFETIKDVFHSWSDSAKIKAAMEVGRSSTREDGRGQGLANLITFARNHHEGKLSIYSLRGMYKRTFVHGNAGWHFQAPTHDHVSTRDYTNTIGGTLIEWSVRLK